MAKKIKMDDCDVLLHAIASLFLEQWVETDLTLIIEQLESARIDMKVNGECPDDESEFDGYFEELIDILTIVLDEQHDYKRMKKRLWKYICSMAWDNFYDDDTNEPYSLGSMFYNKLTWISEGSQEDSAITLADKLLENELMQNYLDKLEQFCKPKEKKNKKS